MPIIPYSEHTVTLELKPQTIIYWFIIKDNIVSDIKETGYEFIDESLKTKLPDPTIEGVWTFKKQESDDLMCVSNNVIHLHFFRTGLVYWKEDKNVKS